MSASAELDAAFLREKTIVLRRELANAKMEGANLASEKEELQHVSRHLHRDMVSLARQAQSSRAVSVKKEK